jgi:hypothetical protein
VSDAPAALATVTYSADFGGGCTATLRLRARRNDADDVRVEFDVALEGPRPQDLEGRERLKVAAQAWVNKCLELFTAQVRARTLQ